MKNETPISLVISIPVDVANKNGWKFTRDAVERALANFNQVAYIKTNLNDIQTIVGFTNCRPYAIQPSKKCDAVQFTVDGVLTNCGVEFRINNRDGDTITDFDILSINI